MWTLQRIGRVGLSAAFVGVLVSACADDNKGTDTDAESRDASTSNGGRSGHGGKGGSGGHAGGSGKGAAANAGHGGAAGTREEAGSTGTARAGKGGSTGSAAEGRLNDGQIAAVTSTANMGEVEMGRIALMRAKIHYVHDFAQMMVDMHGAAQTRQAAVLRDLNVSIETNPTSMQLQTDATKIVNMLNKASASDFDRVYVQSQVDVHMQVLKLFDDQLLPNVTAPALREDLMKARGDVEAHLNMARKLLERVEEGADGGVP